MALDTGTVAAAAGIDEAYEFSAPRFFDFITEETEDDVRAAESWFEAARSHAPSRTYPRAAEAFFLVDRPPSFPPSSASASALISLAEFFLIFFPIFPIPAFNHRIKETRAEAKVAVLCDFAEAEEPAPEVNKRKGIALVPNS